jgi:ribosomal protein S21
MADADLDVVIRQLARQQQKSLMAAAKKRRDRYGGLAAKDKDKQARDRYRQIAKDTMEHATAAARRLQISADNAADSYARSMRQAVAAADAAATAPKKATKKQATKKQAAKKQEG